MNFNFVNLSDNLKCGMKEFGAFHNFNIDENGIKIEFVKTDKEELKIENNENKITVNAPEESLIFRVMTHILAGKLNYAEPVNFKTRGIMIDGSQANSLLNIDTTKLMLKILAGMGVNAFMLYVEDCYKIDDEPYFGYMRPKYTQEEMKQLDDYAYNLGIEMIPCIQTLGHLSDALKRNYPYGDFREDEATLLVGHEKTYELIEKMIKTASAPFRTDKIHLGLDEAFKLGQGKYLMENGYRSKSEIMNEHLEKVYAISQKYNLKPMMWGDMFFRAKSKTNVLHDPDVVFNEEDKIKKYPNLTPVYWDYYHYEEEFYAAMIKKFNELSDKLIFAGCSRNVRTFGAHHIKSIITTNPALSACKKNGVKDVFTTIWGDDNRESSEFSVLPAIMHFMEHAFSEGIPDEEKCARRLYECTYEKYEAFVNISKLDEVKGYNDPNIGNYSPSKVIMWQDILLGIADKDLRDFDFAPHYKSLCEYFENYKNESKLFYDVFDFYKNLASVLEIKSQIGRNITKAYLDGDKEKLKNAADVVLCDLYNRVKLLRKSHRKLYMKHHKPIGWEVLDIRYGGVISRIDTAIERLNDYLEGNIERIEELEEERLSYDNANIVPNPPSYGRLCSASRLSTHM